MGAGPGPKFKARLALGAALLLIGIPVLAQQDTPESLLPPGFGDPPPRSTPTPAPSPSVTPAPTVAAPAPRLDIDLPGPTAAAAVDTAANESAEEDDELERQQKYDMPPGARRSLARIGPLVPATGGLNVDAFGAANGDYLAKLMRASRAPFASRWLSILLRRTLLSGTDTPAGINGADWTAERAWMLVRMGEADAARRMVQSVDPDRYTPRLYAVAMQAFLANADPAGLCPIAAGGSQNSQASGWQLARAICASLSGDQGTASGLLNQAERRNGVQPIDYRLAEKIVGAGFNARRSVTVEWEGVDRLSAWRYGLATAANLEIPERLFEGVGPQVRAWQAQSAMLAPEKRAAGVETAARMGVISSEALVDFYTQMASVSDASDEVGNRAEALRNAFRGATVRERVSGMRTLWGEKALPDYVGLIASARAAAAIPPNPALGEDAVSLIAAMLTAGYDRNAAHWAGTVNQIEDQAVAARVWALLVLGTPGGAVPASVARFNAFRDADTSVNGLRTRMLAAGMAGLGRMTVEEAQNVAGSLGLNLNAKSRWSGAIDRAAARGEPGTVAVLAGIGMQVSDWRRVPPEHLFHIVAGLRRVGLEPEARMIAAEAIART